eukprot:TRINITY_DN3466_c0_g1_i3.p3 TRINITY_DN3466_c0_g1~~TRINITY_DN3466_c0_g1_i3.p3  ORF type:complete len:289 (+),score=128.99 TRINITY_DN3466_c0_g1_i3:1051-1917(+)
MLFGGGDGDAQECPLQVVVHRQPIRDVGRPLMVNGTAVACDAVSSDAWIGTRDAPVDGGVIDAARAAKWTRQAQGEHASVGSFAAFTLQLMANAAPPALLAGASRAAGDEVRHAEQSFALASAYGGRAIGAGPMPTAVLSSGLQPQSLRQLALAALDEGGIAETLSVLRAAADYDRLVAAGGAASTALAQLERDTLLGIVRDETRHAALAWRTVAWASAQSAALADECRAVVAPHRAAHPFLGELADRLIGNAAQAQRALTAVDVDLRLVDGVSLRDAAVQALSLIHI